MWVRFFVLLFVISASFSHVEAEIKYVIFDFGNVIATTNIEEITDVTSQKLSLSKEKTKQAIDAWYKSAHQGIDIRSFWEKYALEHDLKLPKNWSECFKQVLNHSLCEIPGMLQLVRNLHVCGYQTPMLSNTTAIHASIVRSRGFYDYFCPILLSFEMGVKKPQEEAYLILLKRLCASPDQCLFIDDKEENIVAAQKLGIDGIVFCSITQLKSELKKRGILCLYKVQSLA